MAGRAHKAPTYARLFRKYEAAWTAEKIVATARTDFSKCRQMSSRSDRLTLYNTINTTWRKGGVWGDYEIVIER